MKKIFTFLVAFLATMSGAVWGQLGTSTKYYDIAQLSDVLEIDDSEDYYLTGSNNHGIRVKAGGSSIGTGGDNRNKPHIYLKDVSFGSVNAPMGGSAIIIENRTVVTISIEGENSIVSNGTSDAAIKLESGEGFNTAELIFDGTGHLDINMLGNSSVNQVAIGERGVGLDATHNCGTLYINGGTITTNGYIGEFGSHAFRMNGNGIVVAEDIVTSDIHDNWLVDSGLYFEREEDGQDALNVVGNVTINSPIPDENIYIGRGNSLTLGEGDVLDADKVTIAGGGTLNAYKVTYSKPGVTNAMVGNTPADIYCGPNTPLSTEQVTATASPGITYKFLGWTTTIEGADQGTFVAVSPNKEVTDGVNDYPVSATFILIEYPLDIVTGTPLEEGFEIVYPNAAKVTVADAASDPKLAAIGAKLADDVKGVDPDGKATITEDSETKTVTLTAAYTDAKNEEKTEDVVLNLSITENKVDITDGTLSFGTEGGSKVYDGQAVNSSNWTITLDEGKTINPGGGLTLKFKESQEDGNYMESNPVNKGIYYAYVVAGEDNSTYTGTSAAEEYTISARPMDVTINPLSAEDLMTATTGNVADLGVSCESFNPETNRGLVAEQTAAISGTYSVSPTTGEDGRTSYTISFSDLKLVDGLNFLAANYAPAFKYGDETIDDNKVDVTIPDIEPGPGTDIDDGDEDDKNWVLSVDGKSYTIVYDGIGHGIDKVILTDGESEKIIDVTSATYSEDGVKLEEGVLPTNAGNYKAEVIAEGKTGIFSLVIKERPLGVHFNLNDYILEAGGEYDAIDVAEYGPVEVEENVWVGGELKSEDPVLEGKIKVADTPNSEGKYAVTFDGVKLGTEGNFDANNYEPTYYLNGELIELDENGDGTFGSDDDDPEQGIDISEPDDETGISGIGTKRYRLYLANKDYNVVDAKADYAAEGLELFSRHDKKYTKAGGSFTVWYEKDGVANAGGYRIFWSNRANGEYKEVKFDTVSEYFQIRNVQSDVYVKIYAADGFPVGNEEISAADYRAYAQPNKIVVITPQPTDVQIISMAGAVVATDKVTGQREFANLTEGVYIVRMGETVVKLQVRK